MSNAPFAAVNGHYYQFASIELDVDGPEVVGATSIDYSHNVERGEIRGTRRQLIARTKGDYKADASLEMYKPDWDALRTRMGAGYLDKVFPIRVAYGEDGLPLTQDELVRCQIKSVANSHSQGTDGLKVKIELDLYGIVENGLVPFIGFQR